LLIQDTSRLLASAREVLGETRQWQPWAVYDLTPTAEKVVDAIETGAIGYLGWPMSQEALARVLGRWSDRAARIGNELSAAAAARKKLMNLSPREREVLGLLLEGLTNKEMGARLGLSPRTVDVHRTNILKKLGVWNSLLVARVVCDAGAMKDVTAR
jgi:two-component system, LuxR family, response regulator FixJ